MSTTIKVRVHGHDNPLYVKMGATLGEILDMLPNNDEKKYIACYVNNKLRELSYCIFSPASLCFVDITRYDGMMVYCRTLFIALEKAVSDLYPGCHLHIKHSVSKGFYCKIKGLDQITEDDIARIKMRMDDIIALDIPIVKEKMHCDELSEIYKTMGLDDKLALMTTRPRLYVTVYSLADIKGYFYGALAPSTGYLGLYDLRKYFGGMYLAVPKRTNPDVLEAMVDQDKMFDVFQEYNSWVKTIGVSNIGSVNQKILSGEHQELINMAEAFHEKKISKIADRIFDAKSIKVVFVSGPSSSGKTTFAKQLGIQLSILGLEPALISLDDYFVDREKTPVDQKGEYDYEALEAIDIDLFSEHLNGLLKGESVNLPTYDFLTGKSIKNSKKMSLNDRSILIIEGIHGLNPKISEKLDAKYLFKIYVSALTSISLDNLSRISTTDNRLLRRIVRDYYNRGADAAATLKRWPSVRHGEDTHIFPYQENADVMFNSSLFYEISALKNFVEPLLHSVPNTVREFSEARNLLKFLDNFTPIPVDGVPPTSVLREFIGGSGFKY